MRTLSTSLLLCLAMSTTASTAGAQAKAETAATQEKKIQEKKPQEQKEWIKRSNEYAQILIKIQAKYAPEFAARQGVEGLDDQVSQFPPNRREQQKADARAALEQLQKASRGRKRPAGETGFADHDHVHSIESTRAGAG